MQGDTALSRKKMTCFILWTLWTSGVRVMVITLQVIRLLWGRIYCSKIRNKLTSNCKYMCIKVKGHGNHLYLPERKLFFGKVKNSCQISSIIFATHEHMREMSVCLCATTHFMAAGCLTFLQPFACGSATKDKGPDFSSCTRKSQTA